MHISAVAERQDNMTASWLAVTLLSRKSECTE